MELYIANEDQYFEKALTKRTDCGSEDSEE